MLIHHLRVCSPCGCVDVGVFVSYYLFRLHILSFAVRIDRRSKFTADVCGGGAGCWVLGAGLLQVCRPYLLLLTQLRWGFRPPHDGATP